MLAIAGGAGGGALLLLVTAVILVCVLLLRKFHSSKLSYTYMFECSHQGFLRIVPPPLVHISLNPIIKSGQSKQGHIIENLIMCDVFLHICACMHLIHKSLNNGHGT